MRVLMAALVILLAGCASSAPALSPSATAIGTTRTEFTQHRNAICQAGSDDIAAINATMDTMTAPESAAAFRQIADRIRAAQADLDALSVPEALAAFVTADDTRRSQRIALVERLAVATVENPDELDGIDAELTALNIESEHAEDGLGFVHCP
jgi:type IV pilus biogenesis protein CpaD/CtpE